MQDEFCYSMSAEELSRFKQLTLVFKGGQRLAVPPEDYAYELWRGVYCLGIFKSRDFDVTMGAMNMLHHEVIFDRERNLIGFVPSDCVGMWDGSHSSVLDGGYALGSCEGETFPPAPPLRPPPTPHTPPRPRLPPQASLMPTTPAPPTPAPPTPAPPIPPLPKSASPPPSATSPPPLSPPPPPSPNPHPLRPPLPNPFLPPLDADPNPTPPSPTHPPPPPPPHPPPPPPPHSPPPPSPPLPHPPPPPTPHPPPSPPPLPPPYARGRAYREQLRERLAQLEAEEAHDTSATRFWRRIKHGLSPASGLGTSSAAGLKARREAPSSARAAAGDRGELAGILLTGLVLLVSGCCLLSLVCRRHRPRHARLNHEMGATEMAAVGHLRVDNLRMIESLEALAAANEAAADEEAAAAAEEAAVDARNKLGELTGWRIPRLA